MNFIVTLIIVVLAYLIFRNRSNIIALFALRTYGNGDREKGLKIFKFADKFGKLNIINKINLAYLVLKSGDVDDADKRFNLLKMEKITAFERAKIKESHALVYWKRGQVEDAIEMLEDVHKTHPATVTYGSLGFMYVMTGQLDKALEYNLRAFEYNDSDPAIIDNLAFTYMKLQDFENCEKYYEKLMEMNPTFPNGYYEYGKYLVEKGEKERGISIVKKALECKFSFLSAYDRKEIEEYLKSIN